MPTDPISGLTGIMRALRQRMADRSEKGDSPSARSNAGKSRSRQSAKADINELKSQIAARLGELSPDERSSPQATRILVESTLAWEFGDQILTDPNFAKLASDVQKAIGSSPETREKFADLLKGL
jgi:hypothetical protein